MQKMKQKSQISQGLSFANEQKTKHWKYKIEEKP